MWSRSLKKTSGFDSGMKWTWHVRDKRGEASCRAGLKLDDQIYDAPPVEDDKNRICMACEVRLIRQAKRAHA